MTGKPQEQARVPSGTRRLARVSEARNIPSSNPPISATTTPLHDQQPT